MFGATPKIGSITAVELKQQLDGGASIAVLDVRESDERAYCALPLPKSAINLHVPMAELPVRADEIRAAVGEAPLIVYCHHGMRSQKAASWLATSGHTQRSEPVGRDRLVVEHGRSVGSPLLRNEQVNILSRDPGLDHPANRRRIRAVF